MLDTIHDEILHAKNTNYLTHNFHPYPAKFIPHIPRFFISHFSNPGDTVLDPFCGSGTTLVESKLLGRNAVGVDIHPLAVFISMVKTTNIDVSEKFPLDEITDKINNYYNNSYSPKPVEFFGLNHWFSDNVIAEISIIKDTLCNSGLSVPLQNFALSALSSIIVSVSNQQSDTRYAAVNKDIPSQKTLDLFESKLTAMVKRMSEFNALSHDCTVKCHVSDARKLDFIDDKSVDLIVTSPPYPNTYDYYLYHKHRMNWLSMEWASLKDNEIGSRLRHSSRREGIETYVDDMSKCFAHIHRVLKENSYFVIVIGDSVIRQKRIDGFKIIKSLSKKTGFKIIEKTDYNLDDISRMFQKSFRVKDKREHLIILRK